MSGKSNVPLFYRLYAVVVHVDMLNASFFGHYICYVKDSNGTWYKIDDNKVRHYLNTLYRFYIALDFNIIS